MSYENRNPVQDSVPTPDELVAAARALVPVLSARAGTAESLRRLPSESFADLKAAGLHKMYVPRRFGGFEMPWGTQMRTAREIGRACGSTAWIVSLVFSHVLFLARFPAAAQEEIWGENPDAIMATGTAGTSRLCEADGGWRLTGQWRFVSGVHGADCVMVTAKATDKAMFTHFALLEPGQYDILDTWDTEGLRGTGSHDVRVEDQFIPAHRVVARQDLLGPEPPGAALHDHYMFHNRPAAYQKSWFAGPLAGVVRGALESYLDATRGRRGALFGESIIGQTPVQVRLGETVAEIEAAETLMTEHCARLQALLEARRELMGEDLLRSKRDMVFATRLCVRAVERLAAMMGGSGQGRGNPVQRHARDVRAIAAHVELNWDQAMALTGKYLFGLKTRDPLIDGKGGAAG